MANWKFNLGQRVIYKSRSTGQIEGIGTITYRDTEGGIPVYDLVLEENGVGVSYPENNRPLKWGYESQIEPLPLASNSDG